MDLVVLCIILVLNTLLALGYLLWGLFQTRGEADRGPRAKYCMLAVVIFLCPVMGALFLGLSHLLYRFLSRRNVDMEDVSFSRARSRSYVLADLERDINVVPMPEALAIGDVSRRRRMLLDVLKRDMKKSLGMLAAALSNPDSETSHYAASVVMDALSEFRQSVQNMLASLQKDPQDGELGTVLLDAVCDVLRQNILSGDERRSYTYTADNVGDTLFEYAPERLDGARYRRLMDALTAIRDFSTAEKWARRALDAHPDQLDVYTGCLNLYFTYGDRTMFFDCLERLKRSGVAVDRETMELIRIFAD